MINQEGRDTQDVPLLGETTLSRTYLLLSMILCSLVHVVCLGWAQNALVDIMVYIFICLIIAPLLYMLFVPTSTSALTYYLAGEIGIIKEQILLVIVASLVSFGAAFAITMAAAKELLNLYHNDPLAVPLPLSVDRSSYMVLFYITFVLVLPVVEESFWRIFLPKSLPSNFSSSLLIGVMYGLMSGIAVECIFNRWSYALIIFIIATVVHFLIQYLHRHTKAFGLFVVSFAMRLGIAISLYVFLFSPVSSALAGRPGTSNTPTSSLSSTHNGMLHHHN